MSKDSEWIPNIKQEQFLALPDSIKEGMIGGGAGFGKSDVLLYYPIVKKWHENPRFKQVFMRRTFPELRNEIVPRAKQIYKRFGGEFVKGEMAFTFPSGAMVYLGHCEDESDVHKYDSMEINLFTPDELTSFTEWIYLYIGFTRVRTSDPTLPAVIRTAGMPGGIGHSWVKKRFVDPYPEGGRKIVGRGGNKRIYIHATLADNPHIDPQYATSLEALPAAERDAKKYGKWDAFLGTVFEEFRDKKYPDEPDNALHVIDPFVIPDYWPKVVVGDWGYRAMTWVGYGAIAPNGRLYVYREQAWTETKIEEWAPYVKQNIDRENPNQVVFCRSAGNDRGQEHTIQEQISHALGRPIELSNNTAGTRVAGKQLIHEYLRWRQKPVIQREKLQYNQEHAFWLLRNKPVEEYKAYMKLFEPPIEETNIPKVQIFSDCQKLIYAIKLCQYDKNKPEDVAEFPGDDPYDGFRYMVDIADRYINQATDEFERLTAIEALTGKLAQTQDWTAYYRNARQMESQQRSVGIRRYR